jgi:hypothetical protein
VAWQTEAGKGKGPRGQKPGKGSPASSPKVRSPAPTMMLMMDIIIIVIIVIVIIIIIIITTFFFSCVLLVTRRRSGGPRGGCSYETTLSLRGRQMTLDSNVVVVKC